MIDVKQLIEEYPTYQELQNSQTERSLHDIPLVSWNKVVTDWCDVKLQHYFLVVDYYSKYLIISRVTHQSAEAIIWHLQSTWIGGSDKVMFENNF